MTSTTGILGSEAALDLRSVRLSVIDGPDRGASVVVSQGTTRIGSAANNALRLKDQTVSRVHSELQLRRDGARILDLESTNGTFVDGVRVRDADVKVGSNIRIGATTLRVSEGDEIVHIALSTRSQCGELVGSGIEMRRVYAIVERVAPTEATILIQGETGTGKDLVARAIHGLSSRATGPFVAVDCGAIAPSLIESELFGHVRGAFSGAMSDRKGLFEEAEAGTLFLDEIRELPLALQAKLLRVLESREIRRVGSNATKRIDVRVLAATNRPLAQGVNDGSFREELYYRLAVVEIRLPALAQRREDIPLLVKHFFARLTGTEEHIPPDLVSAALTRSWPGNVRELRNFVERSVSLGYHDAAGRAEPATQGPSVLPPGLEALVPTHLPLKEAREAWTDLFEGAYARALLKKTGGNVTRAAEKAGVSRRFLQRLLARLGIRSDTDA
jgi:DNA-binding NtrC family response regulator